MIRNLIFSFLFFDFLIAMLLVSVWYANGTSIHTIRLGSALVPFFRQVSMDMALQNEFQIPPLSEVDYLPTLQGIWVFINLAIYLFNSLLGIINFFIFLVNCMIHSANFFRALFVNLYALRDTLATM